MSFPQHRPRRLRRTPALRSLIRETDLAPRHLVAPLFVKEGIAEAMPIPSMPGQLQHTLESLRKEANEIASEGVVAFMLFGVPSQKDPEGSEAWNPDGIAQKGLRLLSDDLGDEHVVIADLCLDEYTDHGHCGVLDDDGNVDNDRTVELYARIAVAQAEAGAHMVGPSGISMPPTSPCKTRKMISGPMSQATLHSELSLAYAQSRRIEDDLLSALSTDERDTLYHLLARAVGVQPPRCDAASELPSSPGLMLQRAHGRWCRSSTPRETRRCRRSTPSSSTGGLLRWRRSALDRG